MTGIVRSEEELHERVLCAIRGAGLTVADVSERAAAELPGGIAGELSGERSWCALTLAVACEVAGLNVDDILFGDTPVCAHCGLRVSGSSSVNGTTVCHPSEDWRPDCYRRITVYGEPIGALVGVRPLLAFGVGDIRRSAS